MADITDAERAEFNDIARDIRDEEANKELHRQVVKTRRWLRARRANGYEPGPSELGKALWHERLSPARLVRGYAAALFKIAHQEEEGRESPR